MAHQAEAAVRDPSREPFLLVGHSSGGWVAHEVAHRLEQTGTPPVGVVLIDTTPASERAMHTFSAACQVVWKKAALLDLLEDDNLCAMGSYLDMFAVTSHTPISAPTLFLEATETLEALRLERWSLPCHRVRTPGDHFSIISRHAEHGAAAIERWISMLAQPERDLRDAPGA